METYWNLMHTGTTYIRRWTCEFVNLWSEPGAKGKHTLKTIKKKGRKWSNISVKKYHQRPVFGVRSGRVSLWMRISAGIG
jgi:hypothetical protein